MWVVSWHAYLESRQGEAHWIYIWHGLDNQPNTKNHYSIGALSVERLMLPKWRWTNTWYFPLGQSYLFVNNVERPLAEKKSSAAYKNLFWGTLFICQYREISINRSWVFFFNFKRFKSLLKYIGYRNTLPFKWNCMDRICTCNELFK